MGSVSVITEESTWNRQQKKNCVFNHIFSEWTVLNYTANMSFAVRKCDKAQCFCLDEHRYFEITFPVCIRCHTLEGIFMCGALSML